MDAKITLEYAIVQTDYLSWRASFVSYPQPWSIYIVLLSEPYFLMGSVLIFTSIFIGNMFVYLTFLCVSMCKEF